MEQVKINDHHITRTTVICLVILVIIGASCAWYVTRKDDEAAQKAAITNAATTMNPEEYTKQITNPDTSYELTVRGNKIISGPTHIVVQKGQSVNIDFSTPGSQLNIELEGYDIITETNDVQSASGGFHFIADKRGTFKFFIPGQAERDTLGTSAPVHDIQLGTVTVE
ncbi:MAG TPA: hypothetical protein VFL85_00350 [Candidatus Saccharimonadales bacterium]|nr:hypothetical protein [Candidatus Saccharimonadales bacterium]